MPRAQFPIVTDDGCGDRFRWESIKSMIKETQLALLPCSRQHNEMRNENKNKNDETAKELVIPLKASHLHSASEKAHLGGRAVVMATLIRKPALDRLVDHFVRATFCKKRIEN